MRLWLIAAVGLAGAGDAAAQGQRVVVPGPGAPYAVPGATTVTTLRTPRDGGRWGSRVDGRWWGGANAPGGWAAYRRPSRGAVLPRYWVSPRFYVNDWAAYGLARPARGYYWARYYDDAVLIDGRGTVFDSVDAVDWDRAAPRDDSDFDRYDDRVVYSPDDRPLPPPPAVARRDDGVAGAVAGAAVGGVAGNLIAGRGNRLGGTLIGAGVGAAAGYAVAHDAQRRAAERAEPIPVAPRHAPPPPPGVEDAYHVQRLPMPRHRAPRDLPPPPLPPVEMAGDGPAWVSPDGMTTVTTTTTGPGGYGHGYYYPPATTTTVTVQTAPVVTTTTTAVYEDAVTYSRPAVRRVYRKRVWQPRGKLRCACRN